MLVVDDRGLFKHRRSLLFGKSAGLANTLSVRPSRVRVIFKEAENQKVGIFNLASAYFCQYYYLAFSLKSCGIHVKHIEADSYENYSVCIVDNLQEIKLVTRMM